MNYWNRIPCFRSKRLAFRRRVSICRRMYSRVSSWIASSSVLKIFFLISGSNHRANGCIHTLYYLNSATNQPAFDFYQSIDGDHGRVEIRKYWTTSDINWLQGKESWKNLKTIGMVQRERHVGDDISIETSYYISSIENDAQRFGHAVRSHWGIENSLHWVLDVSFREDESRIRKDNAPQNFAVLRHMALNLLKTETSLKKSVKSKQLRAGWDNDYLAKVLKNA